MVKKEYRENYAHYLCLHHNVKIYILYNIKEQQLCTSHLRGGSLNFDPISMENLVDVYIVSQQVTLFIWGLTSLSTLYV